MESHPLRNPLSYIPPGHSTLIVMLPLSHMPQPCIAFRTAQIQDDGCCNEFEVGVVCFTAVQEVPQGGYYRTGEEDRDGC